MGSHLSRRNERVRQKWSEDTALCDLIELTAHRLFMARERREPRSDKEALARFQREVPALCGYEFSELYKRVATERQVSAGLIEALRDERILWGEPENPLAPSTVTDVYRNAWYAADDKQWLMTVGLARDAYALEQRLDERTRQLDQDLRLRGQDGRRMTVNVDPEDIKLLEAVGHVAGAMENMPLGKYGSDRGKTLCCKAEALGLKLDLYELGELRDAFECALTIVLHNGGFCDVDAWSADTVKKEKLPRLLKKYTKVLAFLEEAIARGPSGSHRMFLEMRYARELTVMRCAYLKANDFESATSLHARIIEARRPFEKDRQFILDQRLIDASHTLLQYGVGSPEARGIVEDVKQIRVQLAKHFDSSGRGHHMIAQASLIVGLVSDEPGVFDEAIDQLENTPVLVNGFMSRGRIRQFRQTRSRHTETGFETFLNGARLRTTPE